MLLFTTGNRSGYASLLSSEMGVSARAFCVSEQNEALLPSFISLDGNHSAVSAVASSYTYIDADVASSAHVSAELTVEKAEFSFDGSAELDTTPVIGVTSDLTEDSGFQLCTERDFFTFCITVDALSVEDKRVECFIRCIEALCRLWKDGRFICVLTQKFRN